MQAPKVLEIQTRPNLEKFVLDMVGDDEIVVTDANLPICLKVKIIYN
jgi:D-ribose pyranose/furanose isomerase RbsD